MRATVSYVAVMSVPLLATAAAVVIVPVMGGQGWNLQLAHMLLFATFTLLMIGVPRHTNRVSGRSIGLGLMMAFIPCGLMLGTQAQLPRGYSAAIGILAVGAALEEFVFRWLLPYRALPIVRRVLPPGPAAWASLVGPQLVFALSHWAARLASPFGSGPSWMELERIFAAGLLFQSLQLTFGLGAAIGIHISVNYAVLAGRQIQFNAPSLLVLQAFVLGGLFLLGATMAFHRRQVRYNIPTP